MSVKQMALVWDLDLAPNKRLVLLAYADHADDQGGSVFPSLARIAHKTGYSRKQVKRITQELRDVDHLMEKVADAPAHGRGIEYRLTLHRGDILSPLEPIGGTYDPSGVGTNNPSGVGSPMSPEPSIEPSIEPSVVSAVPDLDDVTASSLLLLSKVPGFPKDQAANAIYLAGLREEFPNVDALEVCRQYQIWHVDNPKKTRNFRARLRNFFAKANEQSNGHSVANGANNGKAKQESNGSGTSDAGKRAIRDNDRLKPYLDLAETYDFSRAEAPYWLLRTIDGNDTGGRAQMIYSSLHKIVIAAEKSITGVKASA